MVAAGKAALTCSFATGKRLSGAGERLSGLERKDFGEGNIISKIA